MAQLEGLQDGIPEAIAVINNMQDGTILHPQYNDTLSRQTRLLRCGVLGMQNFMGASAFTCILAALQPTKPVVVRGEIPVVGKPLTQFSEMHCLSDAARPLNVPAPSHVSTQSRTFSSSRVRRPHSNLVSNSKTEDGVLRMLIAHCSLLTSARIDGDSYALLGESGGC
jgi:hypothetical protein